MYIVKRGELAKRTATGHFKLKRGCYFGEHAMLNSNCRWKETVTTDEESELIAIGAEDIENILGRSLPLIVIRNRAK
jgi:CRP-like cAMP-binding protein